MNTSPSTDMPKGQIRRVVYQQDGVASRVVKTVLCGLAIAYVRPIVYTMMLAGSLMSGGVPAGDPTVFLAPFQPALWIIGAAVAVIFSAVIAWRAERVVTHIHNQRRSHER